MNQLAPAITTVTAIRAYVIRVEFADGEARLVDLTAKLDGPVFGPLRDFALFKQVHVDDETQVPTWPNGADLDKERIYYLLPSVSDNPATVTRA